MIQTHNISFAHTHTLIEIQWDDDETTGDLKAYCERWGAGVETQKNVRGEVGGWGGVPFNEPYAPSLSTIYDGA